MTSRLEEMASKTLGQAKLVKATFKGFRGVFKTLAREHGEAAALIKRIALSSDSDLHAVIFPQLRDALLAHERAELAVIYPLLRQHDETRSIAEHHNQEARELELLLTNLHVLPFDSLEWKPTFERLAALVERHVSEEEGSWFATAQKVIGERAAEQLEQKYLAKKKQTV